MPSSKPAHRAKPNQSLNNLLVFESAARRASFTRAAEDLGISQPAVSHAMRLLEADLGVALFERQHKGVQTTEAGQYLLEQVGMGLSLIDQALREVRSMQAHQVTLAVSTATATWWLLPRVARFKQLHPDIELRVITTDTDLDMARERIDLSITLGADDFANYQKWHFVDEEIFPVCSPRFLKTNPLPDLQALVNSPLLLLEERYRPRMDWKQWLARFNTRLPRGPQLFADCPGPLGAPAAAKRDHRQAYFHHRTAGQGAAPRRGVSERLAGGRGCHNLARNLSHNRAR
jgi:DNA-binding transcriptional LysR family regulator